MVKIENGAWTIMVQHAESVYPNECCGAMLGSNSGDAKQVTLALPLQNVFAGNQNARYQLRQDDLLAADKAARERGLDLIGIFHSHPDCDAYFSETDLQNSCPWFSFVILSIQQGKFHHAHSFVPDLDQTSAEQEELQWQ